MLSTCYCFGTFNPVHFGHLLAAEQAKRQYGFDKVVFVPAAVPPHRQTDPEMSPFTHRLAMVQRACRDNPYFDVSDVEGQRPGPSYTVDTLRILAPDFETRAEPIPLIIGTDALAQLATWHQADILIQRVRFLQAPRGGMPLVTQINLNGQPVALNTEQIDMPFIGIASTKIRQRLRQKQSIRYLTPQSVADYIDWNNLYCL